MLQSSSAQSFHLGLFGGLSNYQGDLVDKAYVSRFTKPAIGITGTYELSTRVNLRGGLTFAKVAGNDKFNSPTVQARNLNFESKITELSLLGEFNVFNLNTIRWTPYVFGGLAIYHFNPYTYNNTGIKTFLKPLSTEGQGIAGYDAKPYSLTQVALPFGGGIKYAFSDNVRLGLEVGMRKLFTDYLDDVSTNYADPATCWRKEAKSPLTCLIVAMNCQTDHSAYPQKGAQRGGAAKKTGIISQGLHLTFRLERQRWRRKW